MSIIHKSPQAFTDTSLPALKRDLLISEATQFRMDFTNEYTKNGKAGALFKGDALRNLVDGKPDMTVAGDLDTYFAIADDGIGLRIDVASGSPHYSLGFPAGSSFDMHEAGDHNFIVHIWLMQDADGAFAAPNSVFGARDGSTNASSGASPIWGTSFAPFMWVAGGDGKTPVGFTRSGGAAPSLNYGPSGLLVGAARLLSFAWTPSMTYAFLDGVQVATAAPPMATVPSTLSHTTLTASANPSAGETVTINGTVITFGTEVAIGASATATMQALKGYINANRDELDVRAEGAAAVLTVLRTDGALLTLAEAGANLSVSAITTPVPIRLLRAIKGTYYALAMEDLTKAGRSPSEAATAEYAGFKPRLQALRVTVA